MELKLILYGIRMTGDIRLERMVETRGKIGVCLESQIRMGKEHSLRAEKLTRESNEDTPSTDLPQAQMVHIAGLQGSRRRCRDFRWWGVENERGGRDVK